MVGGMVGAGNCNSMCPEGLPGVGIDADLDGGVE